MGKSIIQSKEELENWYTDIDPWQYENNPDDQKRKLMLLNEIPEKHYRNTLDIGCGNGFITRDLPGDQIKGTDISANAIAAAKKLVQSPRILFEEKSIFNIHQNESVKYDLIVITGVLYSQYIGKSSNLIYLLIDQILNDDGILISVHIDNWYNARFPYALIKERIYPYQTYLHRLEVYQK